MKKKALLSALVVVALLMATTAVFAQPMKGGRGSGGWGAGGAYQRMYNPATVETITGEVVKVDTITTMKGMTHGIHLQVKTDKETIPVHLGPAWYIERQDTKIAVGDKVEVKGSRITFSGAPAILAAEVKKGDAVLKLRDDKGFPAWAGWRKY